MRLTNVKAMVAKVMTVGMLAGAFAMAAPVKAEAQQVVVGFGYRPYYVAPGYYERLRIERERRFEFERHEAWVRGHEYHRW